ncbi:MAG: NAD-dependent epimerase/dehydratase family protein [Chloroflexi bacterium]|nr:NAD-dependent epimerase/dehydratase family protein [Chloroflexota bacterium]
MATLITGGTGFIGTEVARRLLAQGETDITLFDLNPSPARLDDLAGRVRVVRGDLGNMSHVLDAVATSRPRTIYHLGAMLSAPAEANPTGAIQTNAMGTLHVLEAARLFEVAQVIFTSTVVTFGRDLPGPVVDDTTLQRPQFIYGITKVFGEHLCFYYRRRYGIDARGVRFPSIVGPGVKTPAIVQYNSWMIEAAARGTPFTAAVRPETVCPILYFKDAARALVRLAAAPAAALTTVIYGLAGVTPPPSAGDLAERVRARVPAAQISFAPDPAIQDLLDEILRPVDDHNAQREWGWEPAYDLDRLIDDFLAELRDHPARYA